ncbi:MAG: tetratricopeptide repeat protein [Bacteroidales bacterium]|nr:tetratricopeptide repeat protein [Bacteroidales bacterium]
MKKYVILIGLSLLVCLSCKKQKESPYKSSMRETLLPQIKDAVDHSDYSTIILLCDSLKKNGEKHDDVLIPYAEALVATGKAEQAITVLKKELEKKESHTPKHYLYHEMGDAYWISGDTTNAIVNYQEALKINPSYARPYIRLANIFVLQGEKEKARDNYLAACDLFERHQFYKEMVEFGMKAYELDTTNEEAFRYIENGYKGLGYTDE